MIQIYTKKNCVACKMSKKWLSNYDIEYHENNVDEDLDAFNYLLANNLRTLPVVFDDSELIAMGFQPHKLKTLLN